MQYTQPLKERVHDHLVQFVTKDELDDHTNHTDNDIKTQKEYLKRLVSEHSENPLYEADTIQCINSLDDNSICPFIKSFLA